MFSHEMCYLHSRVQHIMQIFGLLRVCRLLGTGPDVCVQLILIYCGQKLAKWVTFEQLRLMLRLNIEQICHI